MIITSRFVYLHLPKTGGTFVATVLMEIHRQRGGLVDTVYSSPETTGRSNPYFKALRRRDDDYCIRLMVPDRYQHGVCSDIPVEYRDLPVVATVRNPLDRYVSQFSFGWWKKDPDLFGGLGAVRAAYPTYPDLSFAEFIGFANDRLLPVTETTRDGLVPGLQSQQFILQYAADPRAVISRAGSDQSDEPTDGSFCPHRYLHQEWLQEDLANFMDEAAYESEESNFVRTSKRIYPPEGGRPASDNWRRYYTPELESRVRTLEEWLLRRFPEYAE